MIQPTSSISFKAIQPYDGEFTPIQYSLKKDIISELRRPIYGNQTIEKYYENNYNAFRILPIGEDKVELHKLTDITKSKSGAIYDYHQAICEGIFDKEHPFNPKKYIKKMKIDRAIQNFFIGLIGTSVAVSLGILALL